MSVRYERVGRHGEIVLDRPTARNALDDAMLDGLAAALDAADADGARALLLRGEGAAFCAGRDLGGFDPARDDAERWLGERFHPLLARLADRSVPTVCAVQGAALGAGLGIAFAADVVYAADDARFGSPFRAIGAVLDSGGHFWFERLLGAQKTMELVLTGRLIDGREAERIGLVARSLARSVLLEEARALAETAAAGPTRAFAETKRLLRAIGREGLGLDEVLAREARAQGAASRTRDYAEGIAAFREKRRPDFEGR